MPLHLDRLKIIPAALLLAALTPSLHAAPPAGEPLLSNDEIHKLVDAGQYKDALKALARVLQLTGPAAAGYDRNDLYLQRAECQFQQHDTTGALATLQQAIKEATAANQPNPILTDTAFSDLLLKSPGGVYVPKTASAKGAIKIADRAQRKVAYEALFADDLSLLQTKAAAAEKSGKLLPLLDAAKIASSTRAAEYAATGATDQTTAASKELGDQALKLVNSSIDDMAHQQSRIWESASRVITEVASTAAGQSFFSHCRGLTDADKTNLKAIVADSTKMPIAAKQLALAFPAQADDFKAAGVKATELESRAAGTLRADYTGVTAPPPPQ